MRAFIDDFGVVYEITKNGKIYLTLPREKKRRFIGQVIGKVLHKDRWNTYIFKRTQEFGFPYEVLKYLLDTGEIEEIQITLGDVVYRRKIKSEDLKGSKFRHFKRQGYERQVFIKISEFEKIGGK